MSSTIDVDTAAAPRDARRERSRFGRRIARPSTWAGVAAGLVVTAGRLWFAADRRVFHVVADEPGQLAMARWLAGGTRWNMFDHNTWRPGYSLVVAPVYWIADSGEGVVRATLTLNAVMAGISAVLLASLLGRWTAAWRTPDGRRVLGPWSCAGIAGAVALAPAAIAASAYTWAEAMVTLTFLATLWLTQRFVDSGLLVHALGAALAAAISMTTHGRSLALLPVVIAIVAGVLALHARWVAAAAVIGYGALLGLVSVAFTRWVHEAVWDDPSDVNTPGSVIERLDAPAALADSFVGQAWYQLVASMGLVGVGAGFVVASLWAPRDRLDRRSAAVLIALTAPLALTSVTFMADRVRSDQLVYGRYVDAVVWPLVAIGAAALVRLVAAGASGARRRTTPAVLAVAATTGGFGLVVAWRHGDQLAGDVGLRMMVPGLLPYIGTGDGVPVLRITAVVTLTLLAVAFAATTWRGDAAARHPAIAITSVLVAVVLGWSAVRVHDAQARVLNVWAIGDAVSRIEEIVPGGEPIGVLMVPDTERPRVDYSSQRHRYQVYQLYLPGHEFVWERTPQRIASRFVLAPAGTSALVEAGARVRWGDPRVRMALWELPERSNDGGGRVRSPR